MTEDNEMLVVPYKQPSDYGKTRFLVELFIKERIVVSVYADSKEQAVVRAKASPYRMENSLLSFPQKDGIANVQFDEDYDFQVTEGDVLTDEEPQP